MSLRTYSLITHPKYLRYVEERLYGNAGLVPTSEITIPRIDSIQDIAEYLRISHNTIRFLLINTPKYYRSFDLIKRSGGTRKINAPRLFLKVIQWWIKDTILDVIPCDEAVHGFLKGRSFVTNAQAHLGATNVLNVDVKNCFDSLDGRLVEAVFLKAGYSGPVALQLAALCSLHGALPQGAPTSPMLLNLILRDFDTKIRTSLSSSGVTYTRYADDLTFSAKQRIDDGVVDLVQQNLALVGLSLNEKKTRFMGVNSRKIVTGLVLGRDGVNLPPEFLNSLRGWIGSLEKSSILKTDDIIKLRGTLALLREVGGVKSAQLLERGAALLNAPLQ